MNGPCAKLKRRAHPEGEGGSRKRVMALEDGPPAEHAVAEATAYHLVNGLNWDPDEAVAIIKRLRAVTLHGEGGSEGSLRNKLWHAYTDLMLSKRRSIEH